MLLKCLGDRSSSRRKYPTVVEELCPQFSLSDLRKSTNNFDESNVIGLTKYRKIYKGCLQRRDAPDVALKRFNVKDSRACELFKNEIELFCQLRHPNCISLKGFCNQKKEKITVYEYMSNGSLYKHLGEGKLSWKKRLEICIGAARGLHYLHTGVKRSIFHRDFRPSSILLDHNMEPKLSNFDLCLKGPHFLSKPKPIKVDHIEGTCGYMAREYLTEGTITDKCDVFSFGVVLVEVVCGGLSHGTHLRWPSIVEEEIDPNIKGKIAPECWNFFIDITKRCLKYESDERPTIGEIEVQLEHALSLQEQADSTNTNGDYALLSKTIIKLGPNSVFQHAPLQETDIEDNGTEFALSSIFYVQFKKNN